MNCEQYFTVTDSKIKDNIVIIFYLSVSGFFYSWVMNKQFCNILKVKSLLIIHTKWFLVVRQTLSNSFEIWYILVDAHRIIK